MIAILGAIAGTLLFALLFGSFYLWSRAIVRLMEGRPLVEFEARRPTPWGLVDLIVIFAIVVGTLMGLQSLAMELFDIPQQTPTHEMDARQLAAVLFSSSLGMLVGCVVSVGLLLARGASWKDLGVQASRLFDDVKLGGMAFVMLAPPMYLLQFVLTRIWPSEHPIQKLLLEDPDVAIIAGGMLTAMIIAPLTEEIFFRLIFQGWMEKFSVLATKLQRGYYVMSLTGAEQSQREIKAVFLGDYSGQTFVASDLAVDSTKPAAEAEPEADTADVGAQADATVDWENPYAAPGADSPEAKPQPTSEAFANPRPSWWPIFVSATIFALLHWGHGPDPAPLFLLALGLGFLYHRTHRILPCIVVHFLVNSLSMAALVLFLLTGGEPQDLP